MERETWTSRIGFVLAAVGSAIGLGNIWLFPWRLGSYGGAAVLVPYLIFVFLIATVGLMEEFAFGRSQKKGMLGAFEGVFKEKGKGPVGVALGIIPLIAIITIFVFYTIVVGWMLRYLILAVSGQFATMNIPEEFNTFVGTSRSIGWHAGGVALTLLVVLAGVRRGIERVNKFLMPLLFALLVILLIRSVTLPGSGEGLGFLLLPDWSRLGETETWIFALGQAFFTVSLSGATMLVYGSYASRDTNIPAAATQTVVFNTLASLLAAFVIMPAVFAFNLDPAAGPGLLFVTIPNVFNQMPGGVIFGALFFLAVLSAGVSSSISMLEPIVEAFMDRFNMSRKLSVFSIAIVGFALGIPLDVNMGNFGMWADISTIYLLPIGATIAAIVFFWVYGADRAQAEINTGAKKPLGNWIRWYGKYVFVGITLVTVILNIALGGIG
jgi:NSS family neurotransmitter:Na+ symporter